MLATALLFASLACPKVKLINTSGHTWNKHDETVFKRAVYVCSKDPRYASDTPCVGMFHKKEERGYLVLCTYKKSTK